MSYSAAVMELTRQTARLTVRLLGESDRDAWIDAHIRSHDHFTPWMSRTDPAVGMHAQFDSQLQRTRDGVTNDSCYVFVAQHKVDRDLVAFCSLSQVFRGPFQNAYLGWRVSASRIRQGYGVEAVRAVLDLAFQPPPAGVGLQRVQANVIPTNAASLALARRVGFRKEGYAKRYLEIDGRRQDHVMFAVLAEEWLESAEFRMPSAE